MKTIARRIGLAVAVATSAVAQTPPYPEILSLRELKRTRAALEGRVRAQVGEGALGDQFQAMLDRTAPRLNGKGIGMAVAIPGLPVWTGAAGYADRGGSVIYDEHGRVLYDDYGLPMREGAVRMENDDLMYIGSCTKTVMAACVLRLQEDARVSLEDTLESLLPGTGVPYADRMTVRQLLNHRSGVFNYTENVELWEYISTHSGPYDPSLLLGFATSQSPYYEPGAEGEWVYSNTNYLLIGMIIEAITGEGLDETLRDLLFDPLGLENTYSAGLEPTPDSPVVEYMHDGSKAPAFHWTWAFGAGHLLQSAGDHVALIDALFGGSLLQESSLNAMITPDTGYNYGLGIIRYPITEPGYTGDILEHAGGTLGTTSTHHHHLPSGISVVGRINTREFDGMEDHPLLVVRDALILAIEWAEARAAATTWELY